MSHPVSDFQHMAPELRLHCGPGSLDALARELDRAGCRRAAVVCGATLGRTAEVMDLVRASLGERLCAEFAQVRAHSPVADVQAAARFLGESGADAVVAIGGGSAIVTARAASIVLAEGHDVAELCTRRLLDGRMSSPRLAAAKLPQFVLPTTPTTACVKAGSAVLDPETGSRLALFDPKTRARAIFLHPALLATAGTELVLGAGLNTLAMAVEGLESAASDPLSDASLLQALRLLAAHLPAWREAEGQAWHREQLVLAAILCGRGTDVAGGGLASVLGHAVGSRTHAANGTVNAIVLPHTMRFNLEATAGRLAKIEAALPGRPSGDDSVPALGQVCALLDQLDVPRSLREIGLSRDQLPGVAAGAMDDWFIQRNPRAVRSAAEVLSVLEAAW